MTYDTGTVLSAQRTVVATKVWTLKLYMYDHGWKLIETQRFRSLDGVLAASDLWCQGEGRYALIEG